LHLHTLSLNETPKRPGYWCSDLKLERSAIIAIAQKSNKQASILTFQKNNIWKKTN